MAAYIIHFKARNLQFSLEKYVRIGYQLVSRANLKALEAFAFSVVKDAFSPHFLVLFHHILTYISLIYKYFSIKDSGHYPTIILFYYPEHFLLEFQKTFMLKHILFSDVLSW